jgi:hypothetical protein
MTASIQNPADLANLAFVRIGFKGRLGNLYDGSMHARTILSIYAQTRDELLSDGNWEFAERNSAGVVLKSAPRGGYVPPIIWNPAQYPAVPWLFSYLFPADCLKVRAVKYTPATLPDFDPQPSAYSVDNDNGFAPPQRVILSNVQNAIVVYTGQVTDPATWDVAFVEALGATLGRRLAPVLMGADATKMAAADEQTEDMVATQTQE